MLELDRIADYVEFQVTPNSIIGHINVGGRKITREAKIRMAGFSSTQKKNRAREAVLISLRVDIIKDYIEHVYVPTKRIDDSAPANDDRTKKQGASGSGAGREGSEPKSGNAV